MRRTRTSPLQTALDVTVLLACAIVVVVTTGSSLQVAVILSFLGTVFVLDLLDLRLPYGELMPVDTSLLVASLVVGGPSTAAIATVLPRVVVHIARNGLDKLPELLDVLARRLVVLVLCIPLLRLLRVWDVSLLVLSMSTAALFVIVDLVVAQVQAVGRLGERFLQLLTGNAALQWPLLTAQVCVATLVVITFGNMRVWGLVLMLFLVLLIRQSLGLLLEIRTAYRSTIEALVASMEIQNRWRRGHAERVEHIAREVGLRAGLRGSELEALGYAALLHDVDLIGTDADWHGDTQDSFRRSAETIQGVRFLSDVVPVLAICDGRDPEPGATEAAKTAALIVAIASDYDDLQSGRESSGPNATRRVKLLVGEPVWQRVVGAASSLGLNVVTGL